MIEGEEKSKNTQKPAKTTENKLKEKKEQQPSNRTAQQQLYCHTVS